MNCRVWGGVSFRRSYHLVYVIPPLLSTIGGGGCCYSTLHATLLSAMGWGVHTYYFHFYYLPLCVTPIIANSSLRASVRVNLFFR